VGLLGICYLRSWWGGYVICRVCGVVVGWLWRNGTTYSMPEVEKVSDWMENIADEGVPLHGVVDFSGCRLL
jgi:hypothetical protein